MSTLFRKSRSPSQITHKKNFDSIHVYRGNTFSAVTSRSKNFARINEVAASQWVTVDF